MYFAPSADRRVPFTRRLYRLPLRTLCWSASHTKKTKKRCKPLNYEYAADPANFTVCSVSEIVQANPAVAPLLEQPAGGAWEADEEGGFRAVADWQPQD